jgi:hypothetical protein
LGSRSASFDRCASPPRDSPSRSRAPAGARRRADNRATPSNPGHRHRRCRRRSSQQLLRLVDVVVPCCTSSTYRETMSAIAGFRGPTSLVGIRRLGHRPDRRRYQREPGPGPAHAQSFASSSGGLGDAVRAGPVLRRRVGGGLSPGPDRTRRREHHQAPGRRRRCGRPDPLTRSAGGDTGDQQILSSDGRSTFLFVYDFPGSLVDGPDEQAENAMNTAAQQAGFTAKITGLTWFLTWCGCPSTPAVHGDSP